MSHLVSLSKTCYFNSLHEKKIRLLKRDKLIVKDLYFMYFISVFLSSYTKNEKILLSLSFPAPLVALDKPDLQEEDWLCFYGVRQMFPTNREIVLLFYENLN